MNILDESSLSCIAGPPQMGPKKAAFPYFFVGPSDWEFPNHELYPGCGLVVRIPKSLLFDCVTSKFWL